MGTKTGIWDWNKIEGTKNTPKFNRQVLLLEKRGEKSYATVGNLKSVDANGCHWALGMRSSIFDSFFSGMNFPSTDENKDDAKFTPTHWCEIQIPKDD